MTDFNALQFISVQIDRNIETVTREGFGTLLFIGTTDDGSGGPKSGSKVKKYDSFDAVSQDFTSGDPEYDAAEVYFGQSVKPTAIYIGFKGTETYVEALDSIATADNDWYAVAIESRTASDIEDVAGDVQSRNKLFLAVTADSDVLDSGSSSDVASNLLSNSYDRTGIMYHAQGASHFFEAAWAGRILPEDAGSVNWSWKSLSGVPIDTSLSSADIDVLESKRANYYVRVAGNNTTHRGYVSSDGLYLDLTRGLDWLKFRLAEDLVALLAADDVPYFGGEGIVESKIRTRLSDAVNQNIIIEGFSVDVPAARTQSQTDRTNRIYRNVTFDATLQGKLNRVAVSGTVTT